MLACWRAVVSDTPPLLWPSLPTRLRTSLSVVGAGGRSTHGGLASAPGSACADNRGSAPAREGRERSPPLPQLGKGREADRQTVASVRLALWFRYSVETLAQLCEVFWLGGGVVLGLFWGLLGVCPRRCAGITACRWQIYSSWKAAIGVLPG